MNENRSEKKEMLDNYIITILAEKNPKNVEELIEIIQTKCGMSRKHILRRILHLEKQGNILLKNDHNGFANSGFRNYIFSSSGYWYWLILALIFMTAGLVLLLPESENLIFLRYTLGAIFILFLPGYSLIKIMFPEKDIDSIERITLSLVMSLALVVIVGFVLNYSPWGIRITPITISLVSLTAVLATLAITREYYLKSKTSHIL